MNPALNLIYVSGGFTSQQYVSAIDGSTCPMSANGSCTFSISAPLVHIGSAIGVDLKNDNYWAPEVESGDVRVYAGSTNMQINTVTTGYYPGEAVFNGKSRIMWVGAQGGGGNDPVFAVDADTFRIEGPGPIPSGGIMSNIAVNPATGRLYVEIENPNTGVFVSEEVNPKTYLVTMTSFAGAVYAINPVTNLIYAVSGTDLQIVNGSSEKVLHTIALGYTPTFIADNNALHHLYLGNPTTSSIEVRNDTSGVLIPPPSSFPLPAGTSFAGPGAAAVDSVRGRLYVSLFIGTNYYVYAFEDLTTARSCQDPGAACGVGVGIR
jgi:DNA-binding beta-propeller fold protein YncE